MAEPDAERQARFDALQARLVPLWHSIECLNQDEQTIVVAPSIDVDLPLRGSEMQAYEERFLFLLLLLRQPRARLVFVSSQAIHHTIVDYYLDLLPGVIASHARRRLFFVSPLDASVRPLARKVLDRPRLLARIRDLIPDHDRAHLVPFAATWEDRELAERLDVPMYAADPRFLPLGRKSRGRRLFEEEGVSHPFGRGDLRTEEELTEAILAMREAKPDLRRVVVKLDEGVSGVGNALADLQGLGPPGSPAERSGVQERLRAMGFETDLLDYDRFLAKLAEQGGVVEEMIEAEEIRSPSVQLRVTPLGRVELLSTHDQLLGGAGGQSYLGCRFPADPGYAATISAEALKVGERLAREGVLGRFAIDFVVGRAAGGPWQPYAIELNLRKGGTTHPFLTLQFLTDGTYDPDAAAFHAPSGRAKCFVASDHVESDAYRVLAPEDLFHLALLHRLHFDQTRQTGVVFHMMSAMPECGRLGLTAVGDTPQEADALYARTLEVLDGEAAAAAS